MQTYFVWVCAGRMLSQPDAKRSNVIEEKVLVIGVSSPYHLAKLVWSWGVICIPPKEIAWALLGY